jgi:hypothetical protein
MKFLKILTLVIISICIVILINLSLGLLSEANTIANILGIILLASVIYLTITTKFFINLLKKSKNNEK